MQLHSAAEIAAKIRLVTAVGDMPLELIGFAPMPHPPKLPKLNQSGNTTTQAISPKLSLHRKAMQG